MIKQYENKIGTDIEITNARGDLANITGFECSSVQNKTYKNELLNSGFVTSLTPWTLRIGSGGTNTIDTSVYLTSPSSFKSIFTSGGYAIYKQLISFINTHKYYIKANARNTNASMTELSIRIYATDTLKQTISIPISTINTWKSASAIYTSVGTETDIDTVSGMTAGQTGTVYFDDIQLIDLTAHFGAGNEPTLAWCDANITYDSCWAMDIPNTIYNTGDGGVLNVWAHKKNMLPNTLINFVTSRGVTVTYNSDGTYVLNGTATSSGVVTTLYSNTTNKIKMLNSNTYTMKLNVLSGIFPTGTAITFSAKTLLETVINNYMNTTISSPINTKTMTQELILNGVGVYVASGDVFDNVKIGLQLEQGTVATTYEPYTGAEYPITLPVGYVGGNLPNGVKDTASMQNVGKLVLNGTETFTNVFQSPANADYYYCYGTMVDTLANSNATTIKEYCDKFKVVVNLVSSTIVTTESLALVGGTTDKLRIMILKSRVDAMTGATLILKLKAYLTANPVTLLYELATPVAITPVLPSIATYEDYMVVTTTNYPKANVSLNYATTDLEVACNSNSIKYKEYITVDGNTVEIKGKMSNTAYKNTTFFGTFNLKKLEFTTENDIDYKKKEVVYYKQVNDIAFKIGTYIVTDVKDNDSEEEVTVTGFDYGLNFANIYQTDLNYTTGTVTLLDVLQEICTKCGVALENTTFANSSFIVDSNQFLSNVLFGDVVSQVALITGSFATINENDKLELVFTKSTQATIFENLTTELSELLITESSDYLGDYVYDGDFDEITDYTSLDDKRDTQPITSVALGFSNIEGEEVTRRDLDLIAEYGEHWLVINDCPFAYSSEKQNLLIDDIFEKVKGFGYSAFESKYSFKPYLQLGDLVQFKNKAGTTVPTIVLKIDTDFDDITLSAPSITNATITYQQPEDALTIAKKASIKVDEANAEIELKVSKDEVVSSINLSPEEISIKGNKISLEGSTTINNALSVEDDGTVSLGTAKQVIINEKGIVMASGTEIINEDGTLTNLVFSSNGLGNETIAIADWSLLANHFAFTGFNVQVTAERIGPVIIADIPTNFKVVSAYITLQHVPLKVVVGITTQGWGSCKKMQVYKNQIATGDYMTYSIDTGGIQRYLNDNINIGDGTNTESFGIQGIIPSQPSDSNIQIENFTSNDLTSYIESGLNIFSVLSSDTAPTLSGTFSENDYLLCGLESGMCAIQLNVLGYLK